LARPDSYSCAVARPGENARAFALFEHGTSSHSAQKRRAWNQERQLVSFIEAISAAAEHGLRDHNRGLLARRQLERKLVGRRSTSKLPGLIEFVMSLPVVSANMIANELSVTPRAAQNLVAEHGMRERTGRGRYRARGVY
jgi:hypothetical protein